MRTVGILALQGDFLEHRLVVESLGHRVIEIRRTAELETIDSLIIPGGESTTIAKLEAAATTFTFAAPDSEPIFDTIKRRIVNGMPVWGTCMGSIVLAKDIEGSNQGRIGLMNMTVRRNAFGPQRSSASMKLHIPVLGEPDFEAIFIRAPLFIKAEPSVEILCRFADGFVMAREKNMLATAFHPELTSDTRVHEYFLSM